MAYIGIEISPELRVRIETAADEDQRRWPDEVRWLIETGLLARQAVRGIAPAATQVHPGEASSDDSVRMDVYD